MSIVKISDELHQLARARAKALSRSINMQVEHWIRIGKMAEDHPELNYRDIWEMLIRETQDNQSAEK